MFKDVLKNFSKKQKTIFLFLILIGGLYLLGFYYRNNSSPVVTANSFSNFTLQTRVSHLEEAVAILEQKENQKENQEEPEIVSEENQRTKVVQEILPSVVSIVASKKILVYSSWFGSDFSLDPSGEEKEQKISSGTGFLISKDGMILTNKHVVADEEAKYTVITNDNEEYSVEILARDPLQDLALIKIEGLDFPFVELGDSSKIILGQSIICIGNALGEFQNTVSAGVISGLGRHISASGGGAIETLSGVIQTDAAINLGNSGGPLVNLQGEVIGINIAMATSAENIGFAIPINQAKKGIEQVKQTGKIIYPFLGVRYVTVDKSVQEKHTLSVDHGALIIRGQNQGETAVEPGTTAETMGLQENDIILKINSQQIDKDHLLGDLIKQYQPGDKITLEVLRQDNHLQLSGVLGKRES